MTGAFRKMAQQRDTKAPEVDPTRCAAYGCPCRASLSMEGGRFVCIQHAQAVSDRWQQTTAALRDNAWLIALIDDLEKMLRGKLEEANSWRDYAQQFWSGVELACAPDPRETDRNYVNRMRAELMFRAGVLAVRPRPRLPEPLPTGRRGFAFGSLAGAPHA